jgi:hypothetical protein
MGYSCDNHKSRAAQWACNECDSLYCNECIDKRIISHYNKKKTYYFCPKCNLEADRLASFNPFSSLMGIFDNLFKKTSHSPAKKTETHKTGEISLMSRIDLRLKDGNIDDAIALMESERDAVSSDINLSELYFSLLKQKNKTSAILEHGRTYLDLLAKRGTNKRLCELYLECVSISPQFSVPPSVSFKLAGSLIEAGNPKGAADVYLAFVKDYPDDPMTPKASFLAANIFSERLLNQQKAIEILEGIIKKFPDHTTAMHARQYLGQIKR